MIQGEWWDNVLYQHDVSVIVLFMLVLSFVFNWEINESERVRRILLAVAFLASVSIVFIEVVT